MKAIKTEFTGRKTLILLVFNWITMIVLTVYFLGEKNDTTMAVVGTLFIGFFLQMSFLCDQFIKKKKHEKIN
jgi:hypothetical protein